MSFGLESLPAIDLQTLDSGWAFQTRSDRKYVVDAAMLHELSRVLEPGTRVLDIDGRTVFGYESVYFDTPGLRSYRDAAHRRNNRFKVRTRTYLDSGLMRLEVKAKDRRGQTMKHRNHKEGDPYELSAGDRRFIDGHVRDPETVRSLGPMLTNSYHRTTLALPDLEGRVTVDIGLCFRAPDGQPWIVDHVAIIETKAGRHPTSVDRWLWSRHIRPQKVSKYCTALAFLHPELPANRWRTVLSRQFADARPLGCVLAGGRLENRPPAGRTGPRPRTREGSAPWPDTQPCPASHHHDDATQSVDMRTDFRSQQDARGMRTGSSVK